MPHITYDINDRGCHITGVAEDQYHYAVCEDVIDTMVDFYDQYGHFQCSYQQVVKIITEIFIEVYGDMVVSVHLIT